MGGVMKRIVAAVAFATCAFAVAGCGSGQTAAAPVDRRTQITPPTPAPFAERARPIRARIHGTAGLVGRGGNLTSAEFARLLARWRAAFARLAALEPPLARAKPFR